MNNVLLAKLNKIEPILIKLHDISTKESSRQKCPMFSAIESRILNQASKELFKSSLPCNCGGGKRRLTRAIAIANKYFESI